MQTFNVEKNFPNREKSKVFISIKLSIIECIMKVVCNQTFNLKFITLFNGLNNEIITINKYLLIGSAEQECHK
jgi:hypothetical protein